MRAVEHLCKNECIYAKAVRVSYLKSALKPNILKIDIQDNLYSINLLEYSFSSMTLGGIYPI
jgi:hypothetical protein